MQNDIVVRIVFLLNNNLFYLMFMCRRTFKFSISHPSYIGFAILLDEIGQ